MTVDDEGEKFCKGCRLTEAVEAGLKRTCVEIRQRLEKLNKTDLFRGIIILTLAFVVVYWLRTPFW